VTDAGGAGGEVEKAGDGGGNIFSNLWESTQKAAESAKQAAEDAHRQATEVRRAYVMIRAAPMRLRLRKDATILCLECVALFVFLVHNLRRRDSLHYRTRIWICAASFGLMGCRLCLEALHVAAASS
jgi:hypothetical protein